MDGDWLLFMSDLVIKGAEALAERFTVKGDAVSSQKGGATLIERSPDRLTFTLQDGRAITIVLPGLNPDVFSATVVEQSGDDDWSEPASWQRA